MSREVQTKSLKDQNRWPLWLTIAANFALFYVVSQTEALYAIGWQGLLTGTVNLLPVGLALIVTSVTNGLLSASIKARLVFLRWHHALPGHRAFSTLAPADPRIDLPRLKKAVGNKWPQSPDDQNRAWYRIYKEMESEAAIVQVHREFLLTRDYAAFALLFLTGFGTAAAVIIGVGKVLLGYGLFLLAQFLVVRHAAATYGTRLVTTVLARKAAKPARAVRS